MEIISSFTNKKIKDALKLKDKKYRKKYDKFLVEGWHLIHEATKKGILLDVFTSDPGEKGILVADHIIKKLANSISPQPVVGVCQKIPYEISGKKILLLDNVQDPGNVGTLIRSAKAFGWDGVAVKGADIYNSKTIRASQGAIFHIPCKNILSSEEFLEKTSLPIIGAIVSEKADNYKNLDEHDKMLLIIGNEGKGINPEVQKYLIKEVYIPIEFESLNAAVAGSILLNEYK